MTTQKKTAQQIDAQVSAAQRASMVYAPHSQEAEQAVIGAALISGDVYQQLRANDLRADDFYFLRHVFIWQAVVALLAALFDGDETLIGDPGDWGFSYIDDPFTPVMTAFGIDASELVAEYERQVAAWEAASDD